MPLVIQLIKLKRVKLIPKPNPADNLADPAPANAHDPALNPLPPPPPAPKRVPPNNKHTRLFQDSHPLRPLPPLERYFIEIGQGEGCRYRVCGESQPDCF